MSLASRLLLRSARSSTRAFSTTTPRLAESVPLNSRSNDTAKKHREFMLKKPLNPHMTNTNSTIANDFPSVGKDKPPADQITSVDPNYIPKDSVPENTERMTGGTQPGGPTSGPNAELDVGEIEGGKFRVAPLRREGESDETLRARLIYQSRKRGTLESDLLLSTFAREYLPKLSRSQLEAFDRFLDENDWDIYYWATQTAPPTSHETAEGGSPSLATPAAAGADSTTAGKGTGVDAEELSRAAESGRAAEEATAKASNPSQGEWRYTIGTFKPAYRPVPSRWKNSEILSLLRKHVLEKSAGGVVVEGEAGQGGGLGMMPDVDNYKRTASKA